MKLAPILAASAALLFAFGAGAQSVKPCKPAPVAAAGPVAGQPTAQQASRTETTITEAQKSNPDSTPQMADASTCDSAPPPAR